MVEGPGQPNGKLAAPHHSPSHGSVNSRPNMQKFEYRTPRYKVDLPVLLILAEVRIPGRCREISKEGMSVEFRQALSVEVNGTVSLNYKNLALELGVSVAHSGNGADGLKFRFETEQEKAAVERLIALLAGSGSTGQSGPVLVR